MLLLSPQVQRNTGATDHCTGYREERGPGARVVRTAGGREPLQLEEGCCRPEHGICLLFIYL